MKSESADLHWKLLETCCPSRRDTKASTCPIIPMDVTFPSFTLVKNMLCLIFAYAVPKYKADHRPQPLNLKSTYKSPKMRKGQTKYSHGLYTYNCSTSQKTRLLKRLPKQLQLMEKHPSTGVSYHPTERSAIVKLEGNGTQKSTPLSVLDRHTHYNRRVSHFWRHSHTCTGQSCVWKHHYRICLHSAIEQVICTDQTS